MGAGGGGPGRWARRGGPDPGTAPQHRRSHGKWEVIIAQGGREYEIELAPRSVTHSRLDYD
jgi:hypothetical protein